MARAKPPKVSRKRILDDISRVCRQYETQNVKDYQRYGVYSLDRIYQEIAGGWTGALRAIGLKPSSAWHPLTVHHTEPELLPPERVFLACLKCDKPFKSPDRRSIRICDHCKGTQDWREPTQTHRFGIEHRNP